jgi:hypothetical protein
MVPDAMKRMAAIITRTATAVCRAVRRMVRKALVGFPNGGCFLKTWMKMESMPRKPAVNAVVVSVPLWRRRPPLLLLLLLQPTIACRAAAAMLALTPVMLLAMAVLFLPSLPMLHMLGFFHPALLLALLA